MYNRIVGAPGQTLKLGTEGGNLLLNPPGTAPGAMTLTDMQNRTWHLLREDGPDVGLPAPTLGDFSITTVTRDLNIALAQFVSETGIAPAISERMDTFPVFAGLDYPVPPALASLIKIEYTPFGSYPYEITGLSMQEFKDISGGIIPPMSGQPRYYREPFAGYIRLQPQPGPGNAAGPSSGSIALGGTPVAGEVVTITLTNGALAPVILTYTVLNTDTNLASVVAAVIAKINASAAVVGNAAFLAPSAASQNTIPLISRNAGATGITYFASVSGTTMTITPTTVTTLLPSGDTMTFYYATLGTMLVYPGDCPGISPQFHMAIVYRVLMDYWRRKSDIAQAREYERMYGVAVQKAKAYVFDLNRSTQPTIAGNDDTDSFGGGPF